MLQEYLETSEVIYSQAAMDKKVENVTTAASCDE